MTQQSKQAHQVNHRQFITWREFTNYFEDYREIKDRNRNADLTKSKSQINTTENENITKSPSKRHQEQ